MQEEKEINLALLDEPFPEEDIRWRIQRSAMGNRGPWALVLAYVTNRAIQRRLDIVCGKEGWQNEYVSGPHGGVLCGISIKIGDEWVTKWDGADKTNVEEVKGGLSDAMKRAAVQWGVGSPGGGADLSFEHRRMQERRSLLRHAGGGGL